MIHKTHRLPSSSGISRAATILLIIGLSLLLITASHMNFMTFSDKVGFFSNHDHYFHVRHPVRALIRDGAFFLGLGCASLAFIYLSLRQPMHLAWACWVAALFALLLLFISLSVFILLLVVEMKRADSIIRHLVVLGAIVFPQIAGATALIALRRILRDRQRLSIDLTGCIVIECAALGTQSIWLLVQEAIFGFIPGCAGFVATLAMGIGALAAGRQRHRNPVQAA